MEPPVDTTKEETVSNTYKHISQEEAQRIMDEAE